MEEIARMHNEQQFKKQQDAIARLQSEITHNNDSNLDLIDVNRRLEEQIRDAEANNKQLELQMQQREGNTSIVIDELMKEITDLESTLNKDTVDLIHQVDKLKDENSQCQSSVEEGSLELHSLRNQVNDAQLLKKMRPSEKNKELMKIVEEGNVTVLPILLQMGVNISTKDGFGSTSLHRAARRGRYEVAEILINAGADIEEKLQINATKLQIQQLTKELQVKLKIDFKYKNHVSGSQKQLPKGFSKQKCFLSRKKIITYMGSKSGDDTAPLRVIYQSTLKVKIFLS
ncbi:hypothetical protein C0J52_26586 [Blattella germanica]|nr:hypothetical protein C0J52_26586 [Blattella germanica]